jgi:hypothetical protein
MIEPRKFDLKSLFIVPIIMSVIGVLNMIIFGTITFYTSSFSIINIQSVLFYIGLIMLLISLIMIIVLLCKSKSSN